MITADDKQDERRHIDQNQHPYEYFPSDTARSEDCSLGKQPAREVCIQGDERQTDVGNEQKYCNCNTQCNDGDNKSIDVGRIVVAQLSERKVPKGGRIETDGSYIHKTEKSTFSENFNMGKVAPAFDFEDQTKQKQETCEYADATAYIHDLYSDAVSTLVVVMNDRCRQRKRLAQNGYAYCQQYVYACFWGNGLLKIFIGYFYCPVLTAVPEAAKGEDRCCL